MQSVVFDTFAVLAYLKAEPGSAYTKSLLAAVEAGSVVGRICAVNLGEAYYILARERGSESADALLDYLLGLDWEVVAASNELVWAAARLKAAHKISYADAFALACAQRHGADLISGDPELLTATHGTTVRWEIG